MGVFVGNRGCKKHYKGAKMTELNGIKTPINVTERELKERCAKKAKIGVNAIKYFKIVRRSIDARDKNDVKFVYNVLISTEDEKIEEFEYKKINASVSVLVVGAGPAGLFCALDLCRRGFDVTLIERGENVDERKKSVDGFIKTRILDEESNVQFGEGGAGAFSDGKLNTQVNNKFVKAVFDDFLRFGAPEEIEYDFKPHIGSDKLPAVVKNLRNEIIRLGGKVRFNAKLTDVTVKNGKIASVYVNGGAEVYDEVVLAVGHSARDVYYMLDRRGVFMEPKHFAVGLRIEHLRRDIDVSQYGEKSVRKGLVSASYKLVSHAADRGVFTFCMCPGGYVLPSQSEKETVVVNGMSNYARDGINSNSAVVAQTKDGDYQDELFGGLNFQRKIERAAFELGGGDYSAPVSLFCDYKAGKISSGFKSVLPTYLPSVKFADLNKLFPESINIALKISITDMGKRLKGFDLGCAVLTGAETRTSSPLKITRGENLNSVNVSNLYPCGEGCGYAGGITSAGADGKKVAMSLAEKYGVSRAEF